MRKKRLDLSSTYATAETGKVAQTGGTGRADPPQRELFAAPVADHFQLAFEASPAGKLIVDGSGTIKLVNAQIERMFGYSRDELLNQPIEILLPERYRGGHPEKRTGFFAAPTTRLMGANRDLFGRRKDGSEFHVEIGLNPYEASEGRCVLAVIIDISERKRVRRNFGAARNRSASWSAASGTMHSSCDWISTAADRELECRRRAHTRVQSQRSDRTADARVSIRLGRKRGPSRRGSGGGGNRGQIGPRMLAPAEEWHAVLGRFGGDVAAKSSQ